MRPTRPNRRTIVIGVTAITGVSVGAIAAARDNGFDLNDRNPAIVLNQPADAGDTPFTTIVDPSPESADSPNENVEESADSPFDSPDDAPDPSPASLDSPASPVSADSPNSVDSD